MRPTRPRSRRAAAALAVACAALLGPSPAAHATTGTTPAAAVTADATAEVTPGTPRVVAYYQTIYETTADGRHYVDPLPLVGAVTDVNVGAIHLNDDGSLHVNDITADHPELEPMWNDLATLQAAGVRVHAFVGGAAEGTYRNLAEDVDRFYPLLRDFLAEHDLDGVDLDIEEPFPLENTIHLVEALRADFGPGFTITLTPVARDLAGETSFSGGFAYADLEAAVGDQVDWYNTQFYCGWGDLRTTATFDAILANGFTADRVVAGTVTNPENCAGWVEPAVLDATLTTLARQHPTLGGVFGWELFNALGHDGGGRETWFSHLRDVLRDAVAPRPGRVTVAHDRVAAGAEQHVTGAGFVPDETPAATLTGPDGAVVTLATPVVDADGALALTFRVPDDAHPGEHTVAVHGAGGVATAAFTVTAAPAPAPDPDAEGPLVPRGEPGVPGPGPAAAADDAGPLARTGSAAGRIGATAALLLTTGTALLIRRRVLTGG